MISGNEDPTIEYNLFGKYFEMELIRSWK